MAIPAGLRAAISKIQDTILICPPLISQFAALAALEAGRGYFQSKFGRIVATRAELLSVLRELDEFVEPPVSQGAFYILLKMRSECDDLALVEQLIQRYRIAVIPGSAFGIRRGCFLRIAYGALNPEAAEVATGRLVEGLRGLLSRG